MQTPISTRFSSDTLIRLEEMSASMNCPRSVLIKEAVIYYLDYLLWYKNEVQKGLKDLELGQVKSQEEVKERIRGLGLNVD